MTVSLSEKRLQHTAVRHRLHTFEVNVEEVHIETKTATLMSFSDFSFLAYFTFQK